MEAAVQESPKLTLAEGMDPALGKKYVVLHSGVGPNWQKGDVVTVRRINERLIPLHEALFVETSPAPVKYAASLLDRCTPEVRQPLWQTTPETQEKVRSAMRGAGLLN